LLVGRRSAVATKPNRKSKLRTPREMGALILRNPGRVERQNFEAELRALGDDLDNTLRRIGAYLAWVHRDVKVLQGHVARMRLQEPPAEEERPVK